MRYKTVMDITLAFALLLPVLLISSVASLVYLVIVRENPIYTQIRLGRDKKKFRIYKLKTMRSSTTSVPTHEIDSSSVTKLGAFYRKTKLDELPQLLNVLFCQMSFVGPRPCLPSQEQLVALRSENDIFCQLPGVTGYAQILSVDMSDPHKLVALEKKYKSRQSIILDIHIIIMTVRGKGRGDRVL